MAKFSIGSAFDGYGRLVGRHPLPFIILPTLLTIVLCVGYTMITFDNDVRFLYSPSRAQSRQEFDVYQRFTGDSIHSTFTAVSINSAGSQKNLLESHLKSEIKRFHKYVTEEMDVEVDGTRMIYGRDICIKGDYCRSTNLVVEELINLVDMNESMDNQSARLPLPVAYPVMRRFDVDFYLGTHIFDTVTRPDGQLSSVGMIHLVYIVNLPNGTSDTLDEIATRFDDKIQSAMSNFPSLTLRAYSARILRDEVHKNTLYTLPYISVTAILLVTFTCASLVTGDSLTSKSVEGLLGVMSSTMAVISAAGLLFWSGYPFISQIAVVPFVALAIGIDDTYIILGAWQRSDRRSTVEQRLGETMEEAGLAIAVTSLTDCLSFAIGALSDTPAISIFCTFMAVSIAADFLFQITFFPAIVAYSGRFEKRNSHCVFKWRTISEKYAELVRRANSVGGVDDWFSRVYGPTITRKPVKYGLAIVYAVYISAAIYGCSLMRPNLQPSTLVVDDSPIKAYIEQAESKVWSESLIGQIYVNNTPDLAIEENRIRLVQLATELETLPKFSLGPYSTQFGLRVFLDTYLPFVYSTPSTVYRALHEFLSLNVNSHYGADIQWRNSSIYCEHDCIQMLHWTTAFTVRDWAERTEMLLAWRNVTSKYADIGAVVYDEQNFYTDQTIALPKTTFISLGIALLAMTIICAAFIRDVTIVFWVSLSLLSMDIGIAGFLSLIGADLDTTTVVNILMSIGLSVDFTTHIGYRIHRSRQIYPEHSPTEVVCDALGAVGWPVCQGGISTLLAIIVMLAVKSYVVRMFATTAILVVVIGLFHGLFVLPVLFTIVLKKRTDTVMPIKKGEKM